MVTVLVEADVRADDAQVCNAHRDVCSRDNLRPNEPSALLGPEFYAHYLRLRKLSRIGMNREKGSITPSKRLAVLGA